MAQAKRKDKAKKRIVVVESVGQVHIRATFNNIIISITNMNGQVISWASAGKMGFKGSKKNTPYAAQTAAQNCAAVAHDLGMRKAEIKTKFDEIVAFAEVEKFLDTPVKRYSSGMYVRLAFAVAAHLEPEIFDSG